MPLLSAIAPFAISLTASSLSTTSALLLASASAAAATTVQSERFDTFASTRVTIDPFERVLPRGRSAEGTALASPARTCHSPHATTPPAELALNSSSGAHAAAGTAQGQADSTESCTVRELDGVGEGSELKRRWEGWDTTTTTVYVTNTQEVPTAITVTTTYGENPAIDGGTTVETIYKGASTLTVLGPSYLTLTFYPTSTAYHTSRTTIPTATKTATKGPAPPQAQTTSEVCLPGDAEVKQKTGLVPTHDQSITLYVIAICDIVGIAIGWNLFVLRDLLYPFKVLTVAIHEIGHVFATIILGYRIGFFSIDPKLGGATRIFIGDDREHPLPFGALPAGFAFSILLGGLLTFCGFNTLASKIASFIIGLCWIAVFLRVETVAKVMTVGAAGLMVGLWFVEHATYLRLYILFIGVMSSFYVLWDAADDAFFAKQYPCCPALFSQRMPKLNPGIWTLIWFLVSFILFIGFVLAGLAAWKQSPHAMRCQADTFLPT